MTTEPTPSVTDDLLAELERIYMAGWNESGEGYNSEYPENIHCREDFKMRMIGAIEPALARLREANRDAARYRWIVEHGDSCQWQNILRIEVDEYPSITAAIDEVMRQEG